jgi:tRNA 2-thiouridine synthesizing protein C
MIAAKQFCFLIRHAPDDYFRTSELLDMALTTAAFDQAASVVFLDEGVLHLFSGRQLSGRQKNNNQASVIQMIAAFDIYDLAPPWVEIESLHECGINMADVAVPVRYMNRADLRRLLTEQQVLVSG